MSGPQILHALRDYPAATRYFVSCQFRNWDALRGYPAATRHFVSREFREFGCSARLSGGDTPFS